ncbi:MAG: polyhydroxyalkanoate synthesis repressor PhaR [Alphaproteobacteria bacterium]|nr:polyhydroxyalkanoate synthesis repressor PhaR [Alphaproteobacteria bacterium]
MSRHSAAPVETVIVKKYPNRRLYNTETSMYVTLEDLAQLVKDEQDFMVVDAKTGEDLTRQVLTQIIFELETRGNPLLPTSFLRSVIRFYDNSMSSTLQHYLDASMRTFISNQERIRDYTERAMKDFSPFAQMEELTRQNVSFFEKAFSMFTPFGGYFTEPKDERGDKKKK